MKLINKTNIDFLGASRRKIALSVSAVLVIVSIASLATRGLIPCFRILVKSSNRCNCSGRSSNREQRGLADAFLPVLPFLECPSGNRPTPFRRSRPERRSLICRDFAPTKHQRSEALNRRNPTTFAPRSQRENHIVSPAPLPLSCRRQGSAPPNG